MCCGARAGFKRDGERRAVGARAEFELDGKGRCSEEPGPAPMAGARGVRGTRARAERVMTSGVLGVNLTARGSPASSQQWQERAL